MGAIELLEDEDGAPFPDDVQKAHATAVAVIESENEVFRRCLDRATRFYRAKHPNSHILPSGDRTIAEALVLCEAELKQMQEEIADLTRKGVLLCNQNGDLLMKEHDYAKREARYKAALEKAKKALVQTAPFIRPAHGWMVPIDIKDALAEIEKLKDD